MDREDSCTDEYYTTAHQIFDYCGATTSGTLRVDVLMEKFAPFDKTNKLEYSYLKSLLDPESENPEISVTRLANSLHTYSNSQKHKLDLDESFNKSGLAPQDSDSGISNDGFQLLEDLQTELREKSHLAHQLRSQLDLSCKQYEESLATLTAERDSIKTHLSVLRGENMSLSHARRDYEEASERLCACELEVQQLKKELDTTKKNTKVMHEQISTLENEKLTLQEQLSKSKEECHRINEMYASRQSALLETNERLRAEHADRAASLHDQEHFMQQLIKEKVILEMELKELLNKSNQPQLRLDRSIDVSYTEEQMLTALDTLNADSRFGPENQLLDEESFTRALREEQGRQTNISLYDEIRLSFSNVSKHNATSFYDTFYDNNKDLDSFFKHNGTQTGELLENPPYCYINKVDNENCCNVAVQTNDSCFNKENVKRQSVTVGTNTDKIIKTFNGKVVTEVFDIKPYEKADKIEVCRECEKLNAYATKLEGDNKRSHSAVTEMQSDLEEYEDNLNLLQRFMDEGNERNVSLQAIVDSLQDKLSLIEATCIEQRSQIASLACDTSFTEIQIKREIMSVSTQAEVPCCECEQRNTVVPHSRLRKYLWEPLKVLFQLFAVLCFVCALTALYGVSRRAAGACQRDPTPWNWLQLHDLMDLLLRIEYVSDVPM